MPGCLFEEIRYVGREEGRERWREEVGGGRKIRREEGKGLSQSFMYVLHVTSM